MLLRFLRSKLTIEMEAQMKIGYARVARSQCLSVSATNIAVASVVARSRCVPNFDF
jgi:hypothetical protein